MKYPAAEQREWKPYDPERFITPRLIIVHTNAVNAEDPGSAGGLSWHFQVGQHGTVYQHRDTDTRAAANYNANGFALSIETWDGGDPEGNAWNADQLDALVALIGWCCDNYNIPRHIPAAWDGTGVGFHRMHSDWNNPTHSCPGNTRAAQFYDVLLPRLNTPPAPTPIGEDDVRATYVIRDGTAAVHLLLSTGAVKPVSDFANTEEVFKRTLGADFVDYIAATPITDGAGTTRSVWRLDKGTADMVGLP